MKSLMQRKQELMDETVMLNSILADIDTKIAIWSTIDMIHVAELTAIKTDLESVFLDVLNESNELWLQSIKAA